MVGMVGGWSDGLGLMVDVWSDDVGQPDERGRMVYRQSDGDGRSDGQSDGWGGGLTSHGQSYGRVDGRFV